MKKLSLLIIGLSILAISEAQPDSVAPKKQRTFIASIQAMDNTVIRGQLVAVTDSQVILKSYKGNHNVPAENIKSLTLRRKNSAGRGALIGFGVGAATGIIVGLASGSDPVRPYPNPSEDPLGFGTFAVGLSNAFAMTAGEKATFCGLGLGTTGAIVGAIIGVVAKKKFTFGNKKQKFHDLQGELMEKLVRK